jgi:membrane protease YdiL (CAAX protease family)
MEVAETRTPITTRFIALFQVIVCCFQLPTSFVIAPVLLLAGVTPYEDDKLTLQFFASFALIDTVVVVSLMALFIRGGGESVRTVFFGMRPIGREAQLGVILTPVLLFAVVGLVTLLRALVPALHNVPVSPFEHFFDSRTGAIMFTVVAIVAGGIREELQRAFLIHRFRQHLGGAWVGLLLYTVFFGLFHLDQGWDIVIATGLLGLFWGVLYLKRQSVAAAMVSHAGFNATQSLQQLLLKVLTPTT